MKKTNEQLLSDYRKANKERREKIVKNSGFKNEGEYLLSLIGTKSKSKKKPTIHNVHILDASGSMRGGKLTNAIKGINQEIDTLKKDDTVIYTQTIVDFSDNNDIRTRMYKQPIIECSEYTCSARGLTALYQTIGETLTRLLNDNKRSEKVLVKIFTDGQENNSTGPFADKSNLSELIKECESKGFTVTFVGTELDTRAIIDSLKIDASNTLVHDNTAAGMGQTFAFATMSTMTYASNVKRGKNVTRGFYKKVGKL